MTAIICIALFVALTLFVLGRGTGKTVADVESAGKFAVNKTASAGKTVVTSTPVVAHKAADLGVTGVKIGAEKSVVAAAVVANTAVGTAHRGKALASAGGTAGKLVAGQTAATVRGAMANFRREYQEQKARRSA